jgi:predicted RNase H-like HicB family nuclease/predicted transcriptional regulator
MLQIIIKQDTRGYYASCPQLKGLHIGGQTIEETTNNAKDAVEAYLISMIKHNEKLPINDMIEINLETSDFQTEIVLNCLNKPAYKWRTIGGISKETNIDSGIIYKIINKLEDEGVVLKSSQAAPNGESIYTTLQRYLGKEYRWNRILSILAGEIK